MNPHWSTLAPYLTQHGRGCLSYSVFQPGLTYEIEEGVGFIAYSDFRHPFYAPFGRKIILADPICAPEQTEGMLQRFMAKHKRVIVLHCSAPVGNILAKLGYEVNPFGQECELPMPFELAGKDRAKLRQWRNKCVREGVVVEECPIAEMDVTEVSAISQEWIQDKGEKELALMTRPMVAYNEPGVRYFWARQHGKLMALAIFDPMYLNGNVVGYYHNFDRMLASAPNGTSVYIILEAMQQFEREGIGKVSLGLMPAHKLRAHFKQNDFTVKAFKYAAKHLNHLYPFQGNIGHKKKFAGRLQPIYFSSTQGNSLREVFILMKAMRMMEGHRSSEFRMLWKALRTRPTNQ